MSVPELHRLMRRLMDGYPPEEVIRWSHWRRRHQAIARAAHINRRRIALDRERSL